MITISSSYYIFTSQHHFAEFIAHILNSCVVILCFNTGKSSNACSIKYQMNFGPDFRKLFRYSESLSQGGQGRLDNLKKLKKNLVSIQMVWKEIQKFSASVSLLRGKVLLFFFLRCLVLFNRQALLNSIRSYPSKSLLYFCIKIIVNQFHQVETTQLSTFRCILPNGQRISIQVLWVQKLVNVYIEMS